ncbi:DNA recombination protein RmuC [Aeromicrobium sp. SORGH_AS981]|uniref:DNA recombination protein RmuC n=2 Tax=unclassified Aeromicrobium TaxID=2633570 RepID=UPI002861F762|nr:DNA recombination protein RmuC [Aeromicrobium sp. SORGH_AS_0981]MDR6119270.1 DNA recombination protein RmuC [Aeromicrobium sp. SORGH_AS_0981]
MAPTLTLLLGLLVGVALGVVVGLLVARLRQVDGAADVEDPAVVQARHAAELAEVRHAAHAELADARHAAAAERAQVEQALAAERSRVESALAAAKADVEARLAATRAEADALREQVEVARRQTRELVAQHDREAKERQAKEHSESRVLQKLAPVATQLQQMQRKVEEIEEKRARQHGHLAEQIRATQESAARSQQAAETLSGALRNNTVRGAYGETQLTSLVESAGLLNRIDFSTQESITADSGARRPDMVIKLPGRKQMAVDAKVPYAVFIDANRPDLDDAERKRMFVQHAKAVRAHVDALAQKEYWTGLPTSPEFTVAFIPNDAILNAALDADPSLMEHAFGKGIVLATPVNLWAVLKTVAFTWRQEDLAENAQELVDLGRELYKRLGTLSSHVSKLGRSLERSVKDYNTFVGSLERGVLVTARKLDRVDDTALLGDVQELDVDPRSLTASELTQPPASQEFALFEDLERPEIDPLLVEGETVDDAEEQAG